MSKTLETKQGPFPIIQMWPGLSTGTRTIDAVYRRPYDEAIVFTKGQYNTSLAYETVFLDEPLTQCSRKTDRTAFRVCNRNIFRLSSARLMRGRMAATLSKLSKDTPTRPRAVFFLTGQPD